MKLGLHIKATKKDEDLCCFPQITAEIKHHKERISQHNNIFNRTRQ